MTNVIKVPKPASTFNPHRPLRKNPLISAQVLHFQAAEKELAPELRSGIDVGALETEGQASEYIRKVTRAIHKGGGRAPQKVETAQ
jgi:hypothetical protein